MKIKILYLSFLFFFLATISCIEKTKENKKANLKDVVDKLNNKGLSIKRLSNNTINTNEKIFKQILWEGFKLDDFVIEPQSDLTKTKLSLLYYKNIAVGTEVSLQPFYLVKNRGKIILDKNTNLYKFFTKYNIAIDSITWYEPEGKLIKSYFAYNGKESLKSIVLPENFRGNIEENHELSHLYIYELKYTKNINIKSESVLVTKEYLDLFGGINEINKDEVVVTFLSYMNASIDDIRRESKSLFGDNTIDCIILAFNRDRNQGEKNLSIDSDYCLLYYSLLKSSGFDIKYWENQCKIKTTDGVDELNKKHNLLKEAILKHFDKIDDKFKTKTYLIIDEIFKSNLSQCFTGFFIYNNKSLAISQLILIY